MGEKKVPCKQWQDLPPGASKLSTHGIIHVSRDKKCKCTLTQPSHPVGNLICRPTQKKERHIEQRRSPGKTHASHPPTRGVLHGTAPLSPPKAPSDATFTAVPSPLWRMANHPAITGTLWHRDSAPLSLARLRRPLLGTFCMRQGTACSDDGGGVTIHTYSTISNPELPHSGQLGSVVQIINASGTHN